MPLQERLCFNFLNVFKKSYFWSYIQVTKIDVIDNNTHIAVLSFPVKICNKTRLFGAETK